MLRLVFEGWFQCRLATDPDPPDEPRGVSGWTFAVAGEPDLDRIIRLQPEGATPRLGGPPVGVSVTSVEHGGTAVSDHVLVGARLSLAGDPVFDGRNHIEADAGREPIRPFELSVTKGDVSIVRTHIENGIPGTPDGLAKEMGPIPPELAQRLGISDPAAVRAARKAMLEARLAEPGVSDTERAALGKRIPELRQSGIQIILFGVALPYRFAVNGAAMASDPFKSLGGVPDPSKEWPIAFFMGAWDADALCGFMSGHWDIAMSGD